MAEYYVSPNVGLAAASEAMTNLAPLAASGNVPPMAAPAYAKTATYGPSGVWGHPMSPEAILVLFILLVIITRMCR